MLGAAKDSLVHWRALLLVPLLGAVLLCCAGQRQAAKDDPSWRIPMAPSLDASQQEQGPELQPVPLGIDLLELSELSESQRRQLPGAVDDRAWVPGLEPEGRPVVQGAASPAAASAAAPQGKERPAATKGDGAARKVREMPAPPAKEAKPTSPGRKAGAPRSSALPGAAATWSEDPDMIKGKD